MNLYPLKHDSIVHDADLIVHNLDDNTSLSNKSEQLCRICMSSMEDHEINTYCHCSGSTGTIHKQCLLTWLLESCRTSCEICQHPFDIVKSYTLNYIPLMHLFLVIMGVSGVCLFMVIQYKEHIPFILILMSIFITVVLLFTKASTDCYILKSINIKAYSENTRLIN